MLPNFFIVGAPKAGTTSLYNYLYMHPEIYMSPEKEPNYFSFMDIQNQNLYYKKKNTETREDYEKLFHSVSDEKAVGEASTSYLFYPGVPMKIHSEVPQAKVIIMLRNPVERAFSHYLMDLRLGYISVSFDDVVFRRGRNIDLYYQQYVELGLYHEQVNRYLTTFGKKNVLTLIFDEFMASTLDTVRSVYGFLGVEQDYSPVVEKEYNKFVMPKHNLSRNFYQIKSLRKLSKAVIPESLLNKIRDTLFKSDKPVLSKETKNYLRSVFAEDIKMLETLSGRT